MANPWGFGHDQQFPVPPHAAMPKRPRPDYDFQQPGPKHVMGLPTGPEMVNFIPRDDDRAGYPVVKDTKSIGASYDRYLQSMQQNSYGPGEAGNMGGVALGRPMGGGMTGMPVGGGMSGMPAGGGMSGMPAGRGMSGMPAGGGMPASGGMPAGGGMPGMPVGDPVMMGGPGVLGPDMPSNGRHMGFGTDLPPADPMVRLGREPPLPPDASNTLFVEGLPADSARREVSHIFRPFLGFKEVRLVAKEPKYQGGDPLVLCFVDFTSPSGAAAALNALQGYKMDQQERDSPNLRMQFARYPGPRSGVGPRGKR